MTFKQKLEKAIELKEQYAKIENNIEHLNSDKIKTKEINQIRINKESIDFYVDGVVVTGIDVDCKYAIGLKDEIYQYCQDYNSKLLQQLESEIKELFKDNA